MLRRFASTLPFINKINVLHGDDMVKSARNKKSQGMPKPPPSSSGLGSVVKALRARAGVNLSELAERADLSASTISKIENGQLLPGYNTIQRLAIGLGVDVAELFARHLNNVTTGRRGATKKGEGVRHDSSHYQYEVLAGNLRNKQFLPLVGTIKARSVQEFGELPSHEGEEFVFVISGEVTLHSEYYEPLKLEPGDSVYFDSREGHALVSTSDDDARILWICSDRNVLQGLK